MNPRRSIRRRVLTVTIACLACTLVISILTTTRIFHKQYARALQAQALYVTQQLSADLNRILELGINLDELEGFDEQCTAAIATHPDLAYALVVNLAGTVRFSSYASSPAEIPSPLTSAVERVIGKAQTNSVSTDGDPPIAAVRVHEPGGRSVGYVVVAADGDRIWSQTAVLALFSLLFGLVFSGIGVGWMVVSLRWAVVKPLGDLLAAVQAVGRSPLVDARPLAIKHEDEVGEIGRAFNEMLDDLQRTHAALEEDIAARKTVEAKLARLAHVDELTELPNRAYCLDYLRRRISDCERHGRQLAVLFLDLNRFKYVNDNFGHHVGDQLLAATAARLQASVRTGDLVARLGGDEFLVVLDGITTPEGVERVAEQVLSAFEKPFVVAEFELSVDTSIGITILPQDGTDLATLMRNADTAMYRAKAAGSSSYRFFSHEMRLASQDRAKIETELRRALDSQQFVVHYQPMVDLASEEIVGCEALLRWQHPRLGLVDPDRFLAVAEGSGLIVPIGRWVLRQACLAGVRFQAVSGRPLRMAVNVSARQLRAPAFAKQLFQAVSEAGLSPVTLELEISEGTLLNELRSAEVVLEQVRSRGVRLSIDDFGTGSSSLSHLKVPLVGRLKIDRSFVSGMHSNNAEYAIVSLVIALANSLSLGVVAEGVEHIDQSRALSALGCSEVQGYLYGHPMDEEAFVSLLADSFRARRVVESQPANPG